MMQFEGSILFSIGCKATQLWNWREFWDHQN